MYLSLRRLLSPLSSACHHFSKSTSRDPLQEPAGHAHHLAVEFERHELRLQRPNGQAAGGLQIVQAQGRPAHGLQQWAVVRAWVVCIRSVVLSL